MHYCIEDFEQAKCGIECVELLKEEAVRNGDSVLYAVLCYTQDTLTDDFISADLHNLCKASMAYNFFHGKRLAYLESQEKEKKANAKK